MPTYYINADTGNDTTGNGSQGNPWLTISKAYTSAASGDTIICQDSTATYTFATQTFTKSLTIQGESDDASGAIFDAGGLGVRWAFDTVSVQIDKLTFRNGDAPPEIAGIIPGIFYAKGNGTTLIYNDCIFHDFDINTRGYTGGLFTKTRIWQDSQLLDLTLNNCAIYDIRRIAGGEAWAIFTMYEELALSTITLVGCTIYSNLASATIWDVFYGRESVRFVLKNCIVIAKNTDAPGLYTLVPGATIAATYTCLHNFTDTISGTGNITSDPLLVDPDNGNLNLRPTSPCIDTGILI